MLPGDGTGREVCSAALPLFDLLGLPIKLLFEDIGWKCERSHGNPVPEKTCKKIDASDAVLLSAITSKGKLDAECELDPVLQEKALQYLSPVIQLHQRLDLFANIRPAYHLVGSHKPFH